HATPLCRTTTVENTQTSCGFVERNDGPAFRARTSRVYGRLVRVETIQAVLDRGVRALRRAPPTCKIPQGDATIHVASRSLRRAARVVVLQTQTARGRNREWRSCPKGPTPRVGTTTAARIPNRE